MENNYPGIGKCKFGEGIRQTCSRHGGQYERDMPAVDEAHGDGTVTSSLAKLHFVFRLSGNKNNRHLNHTKADTMIEITMTETAKRELLKVLGNISAKSIRLINQGFG